MLVLSRRLNEKIVIPAVNTTIQIVAVKPGVVRLGVGAPPEVKVFREEVLDPATLADLAKAGSQTPSPPASLHPVLQALNDRLNASAIGLALLRQQLEMGRNADAIEILGKLENELRSLKEQMAHLNEAPTPPARAPCRELLSTTAT